MCSTLADDQGKWWVGEAGRLHHRHPASRGRRERQRQREERGCVPGRQEGQGR